MQISRQFTIFKKMIYERPEPDRSATRPLRTEIGKGDRAICRQYALDKMNNVNEPIKLYT